MKLSYKENIITTINNLIEVREIIFSQIVNLAMSGEFSNLEDAFDQGDMYSFSLKHFETIKDVNVQKIIKLCQTTEESIFTIMDINKISENEVNLNKK
jgi:hypothetical protein